MKKKHLIGISLLCLSLFGCKSIDDKDQANLQKTMKENAKTELINIQYYVDAAGGNDSNNGTSTGSAWKTLNKVNGSVFAPGDQILFKAGGQWTGHLEVTSSGTSASPIVYGMYGSGNKPAIIGTNALADQYVIKIWGREYVEINNLNITSNMSVNTDNVNRAGILIANSTTSVKNHIYVKNCEINNIRCGSNAYYRFGYGGIVVTGWAAVTSNFNDILLDGNFIHDITGSGIHFNSSNPATGDWDAQGAVRSTNVVIRNNTVQNMEDHGIVSGNNTAPLVERNVVINSPNTNDYNLAGIWGAGMTNAVFQYNEVFGISGGQNDATAFDADLGVTGTIFQYNYSHNNLNGAVMTMGVDLTGIYRYNISKDEPTGKWGNVPYSYNNIFYVSPGLNIPIGDGYKSTDNKNNIFVNYGNTWWNFSTLTGSNNNFYQNTTMGGTNPLWADPQFVNPAGVGNGMSTTSGFQLQATSPLINAGISIANNGGKDFFGNALYTGAPDIGVHETNVAGGTFIKLLNRSTSLYLDGMGRTANGDTLAQWSSSGSFNQQWVIETSGSYVKIKNRATGMYVDGMGRTNNGDATGQWSNNSSNNQQWTKETVGTYTKFKNRTTGLYLDGMGRTTNGGAAGQWSAGDNFNQQWQIVNP